MDSSSYSEFLSDKNGMNQVKQEMSSNLPLEMGPSSASVPIPKSYRNSHTINEHFSPSPLANVTLWGSSHTRDLLLDSSLKVELHDSLEPQLSFKMDDDDIFQVDKLDLIQGPTLAELNANEDTLLNDLNFDDLLLPNESVQTLRDIPSQSIINGVQGFNATFSSSSFPQHVQSYRTHLKNIVGLTFSDPVNAVDPISTVNSINLPSEANNIAGDFIEHTGSSSEINTTENHSSPPEILFEKADSYSLRFDQLNSSNKPKVPRLSMSAPTQTMGLDQIWARREPRQHLVSTGSLGLVEAGSTSSLSTGGALSPNLGYVDHQSHDEGYEDSEDDSDHCDDYSSENESGGTDDEDANGKLIHDSSHKESRQRKEKYFWQYNVQAKGPKGQRLVARSRLENPHVLNQATDPVFSPHCALRGIKHSGKARKGDGNDLTPNPRKLQNIGRELEKLSQVINEMTPVSELPFTIRPKTRKEKNKLASRACRLKKKAQHEANKIKLYGLEQEHKRLIKGISQAKFALTAKISETNPGIQDELTQQIEQIFKNATKLRIANHSTEFVNKVLDEVKSGVHYEAAEEV